MSDLNGITAAITTQDLSQARSAQVMRMMQEQAKSTDTQKIDKTAREFEGILLGEWLQQAEKSFASVPGGDSGQNTDPGHDQLQSIGCEFLGGALSKAGGIGIAKMISQHLKAAEASRANSDGHTSEGNDSNQTGLAAGSGDALQVKDQQWVSK